MRKRNVLVCEYKIEKLLKKQIRGGFFFFFCFCLAGEEYRLEKSLFNAAVVSTYFALPGFKREAEAEALQLAISKLLYFMIV